MDLLPEKFRKWPIEIVSIIHDFVGLNPVVKCLRDSLKQVLSVDSETINTRINNISPTLWRELRDFLIDQERQTALRYIDYRYKIDDELLDGSPISLVGLKMLLDEARCRMHFGYYAKKKHKNCVNIFCYRVMVKGDFFCKRTQKCLDQARLFEIQKNAES